jgi:hypothetical protein
MTDDEVIDLLTFMASYDRRTVGRTDVAAWRLVVSDLLFADAERAVAAHYAESRDFAMPADIRKRVKDIRAERIRRSVIEAPPPELASDPREYQRVLQENIRKAGDGEGILAAPERPAVTGPAVTGGPPVSLRGALTDLRRALGPARGRRRRGGDPRQIAAEQVAEVREIRGEHGSTEEAS